MKFVPFGAMWIRASTYVLVAGPVLPFWLLVVMSMAVLSFPATMSPLNRAVTWQTCGVLEVMTTRRLPLAFVVPLLAPTKVHVPLVTDADTLLLAAFTNPAPSPRSTLRLIVNVWFTPTAFVSSGLMPIWA